MDTDTDVLVIGAGPAGSSAAIRLATAGWRVTLMEQKLFPRHKVCGECIAAGGWTLLDELGVGAQLQSLAGPELRQVGWMRADRTFVAPMPASSEPSHRYGRALGRDYLDTVLVTRARSLGVAVIQPAKLLAVSGVAGRFACRYELRSPHGCDTTLSHADATLRAAVVIDARGSWEREPLMSDAGSGPMRRAPRSDSDLLAFKANFRHAQLASGFLPVIAFEGGYGGMVISDHGRTTLACCIRRDALEQCRRESPGEAAGAAIESYLRRACLGVAGALRGARRDGPWLSTGPIRPGIRVDALDGILRVGNAAGEAHPLVGEGIGMALQSSALLAAQLGRKPAVAYDQGQFERIQRAYAVAWRAEFGPRLRVAQLYVHLSMHPVSRRATQELLSRLPRVLTFAARVAGKARPARLQESLN